MRFLWWAAAAVLLSMNTPALAQTYVVNTGGPMDQTQGWLLSPDQSFGARFTLTQATTVGSVEAYFFGGDPGVTTVSIYADSRVPSGNPLFSAALTTAGDGGWEGVFGQKWSLTAGSYWIGFANTGTDALTAAAANPLNGYAYTVANTWYRQDNLNFNVRLAEAAMGGTVPEPATWTLVIVGFGAVGAAMRRHGKVRTAVSSA